MISLILKYRRPIGWMLTAVTLAFIAYATLSPSSQRLTSSRWCLVCGQLGGVDVVLNLALFVPVGVGLTLAGVRLPVSVFATCAISLGIESAQLWFVRGRDASISDLLTNSLGGAAGALLGSSIELWLRPTVRRARILALLSLTALNAVLLVSAVALRTRAPDPPYYGQIKRELGFRPPYAGDVLDPRAAGEIIPNTRFRDPAAVRAAMDSPAGALFSVTVVPRNVPRHLTSIVRIADSVMDEVAVLAQRDVDFVFGVRGYGAALRLRPVYFAVRDAFQDQVTHSGADTIHLSGRRVPNGAFLNVQSATMTRAVRVRVTPNMGWRLVAPREWYADGSPGDDVRNAVWLFVMLVPAMFWMTIAVTDRTQRVAAGLPAFALVLIGLYVIPLVFSTALPTVVELASLPASLLCAIVLTRGARPAAA